MSIGQDMLDLIEGMRIGLSDKKVIGSFLDKKKKDGNKLTTDGRSLDGLWMGGKGIATWEAGKIVFHDLGGKSAQTVQKAIKKEAPKNWLAEAEVDEGKGDKEGLAKRIVQTGHNFADAINDLSGLMGHDIGGGELSEKSARLLQKTARAVENAMSTYGYEILPKLKRVK